MIRSPCITQRYSMFTTNIHLLRLKQPMVLDAIKNSEVSSLENVIKLLHHLVSVRSVTQAIQTFVFAK